METVATRTEVNSLFDFMNLLTLTPIARASMMWSTVNTLNNSIIATLQQHLRMQEPQQPDEVNAEVDRIKAEHIDLTGVDKLAEIEGAAAARQLNKEARDDQGYDVDDDPIETAERLVNLRKFLAHAMVMNAKSKRDLPQPVAESINYRLRQTPVVDEVKCQQLHLLTKVPLDQLRKADLNIKVKDREALVKVADQIVDLAEQLGWKGITEDEVEGVFDELPVQTQYRLVVATIKSLKRCMDFEVQALVRFGRMDAMTNREIIRDVRDAYITYAREFSDAHADELDAYQQRVGIQLPTPEELERDFGRD
jgi:hypothetical protein